MTEIDVTKCKCWKKPWDGCFDYCSGLMVRYATSVVLQEYLNLDEPLADKLYQLSSNEKLVKLSDYKPHLTHTEFSDVSAKIHTMDHRAADWLKVAMEEQMSAETAAE